MKKAGYIILLLVVLMNSNVVAQQFYNGSLEPQTGSSIVPCHNNADVEINTMGHVWKTIDRPDSLFVGTDDIFCSGRAPKDGHTYLGLYYNSRVYSGNRIVLELDAYMVAHRTYRFGFWYKGRSPLTGTGADMTFGYRDTSVGATVDSISSHDTTLIFDSKWRKLVASVTPGIRTKYIWVGVLPKLPYPDSGIVYVDYFNMNDTTYNDTTEAVENIPMNNRLVGIYPNPFTESMQVILQPAVQLPVSISMYDITGRMVLQKDGINGEKTSIDRSGLINGIYFLKVTDRNNNTYMTRVVAE